MILSKKRITKVLTRLLGCTGWSAPVLFAKPRIQVFLRLGPFICSPSLLFCEGPYIHVLISSTLCLLGNMAVFFVVCWTFFHDQLFWKILSGIPSEHQAVWIQIRPDVLLGLIWFQTVCKSYQQMTLVGNELWTMKKRKGRRWRKNPINLY